MSKKSNTAYTTANGVPTPTGPSSTAPPTPGAPKPRRGRRSRRPAGKRSARVRVGRQPPRFSGTIKSTTNMATKHTICGLSDPFCIAARGKLYPDASAGARLAFSLRGTYAPATASDGSAFIVFTPSVGTAGNGYVSTNVSGGLYTLPGSTGWNDYNGAATPVSYGGVYRLNSFGVILRNNLSASNSQGIVILHDVDRLNPGTGYHPGNLYGNRVQTFPLLPGQEVSWVSSPLGAAARNFVSWDAVVNQTGAWSSLSVEIVGAAASLKAVVFEYFVNIEVQVDTENPLTQVLPPVPPQHPSVVSAVSKVQTAAQSFYPGGPARVEQVVSRLADQAMATLEAEAIGAISGLFV